MRAFALVALLLPAVVASQEPAQQSSPAPDSTRQLQLRGALAAYEAHRAKVRATIDKRLSDLGSREDAARSVGRDEFGLTEANLMDPAAFARGVQARKAMVLREDSSANGFLAAWSSNDPQEARRALRWRLQHIVEFATLADSAQVFARELLTSAQRAEDHYKAEDNPSKPAAVRQFVKKSLDYYEKIIRMTRARISLYSDFAAMLRKEEEMLNERFAPLVAAP